MQDVDSAGDRDRDVGYAIHAEVRRLDAERGHSDGVRPPRRERSIAIAEEHARRGQ